jgi:hypothetical protein
VQSKKAEAEHNEWKRGSVVQPPFAGQAETQPVTIS